MQEITINDSILSSIIIYSTIRFIFLSIYKVSIVKTSLIKSVLLTGLFFLSNQLFAAEVECPDPSEFLMHAQLPPVRYDAQSHQVSTVGISLAANPATGKNWLMVIHPIKYRPESFVTTIVEDTLSKLSKVTNHPFQTKIYSELDELDYCLYIHSENKEISAIAYLIEENSVHEFDNLNLNQPKIQKLLQSVVAKS